MVEHADTAVLGRGHFEDFRRGFKFWHICHVDCHGQFIRNAYKHNNRSKTTSVRIRLSKLGNHKVIVL